MTTPFVLLHPLGADQEFWEPVLAELEPGAAKALDLPGHGEAAHLPVRAGIDAFGDVVAGQLAELGTPVHLIGMSLGGLVAQRIGWRYPHLVTSVVLVDTVSVYPDAMRTMWRDRAATARRGDLASLIEPMVDMWFTRELAVAEDPRVQRAKQTFAGTNPEGYARSCDLLAAVDLTACAGSLTTPVVVVCGEHDAAPFRDGAQWLAKVTGVQRVHWLPGRHACAVEFPKQFCAVLKALQESAGPTERR